VGLQLHKVKRPGGVFSFDVEEVAADEHGTWLFAPRGSSWVAPHDRGVVPVHALALNGAARHWVVWWVDDPADRRVEVDICLPPSRTADGWMFVDLELDPVRHASGVVTGEDRDEFEVACHTGWIAPADARAAERVAETMAAALTSREPPFGDEGWVRLDGLVRAARHGEE